MIGPMDFVLGGLAPLAAAAVAFALAWFATRRGGAAWSAGVIVGYAVGALALEARNVGLATAAQRWIHPLESHHWLTLIAATAALPATAAALSGRRWIEWALAVPLCVVAPARLLWSKYRAAQQLRDAGFADDAITPQGAVMVLLGIATATLVAWWLWRRTPEPPLAKTRSLLAIVAAVGAAAVAALTGALVFGQAFGVLAAALGGCAATGWAVGEKSGPEAARGPTLLLAGSLLAAAVCYSELHAWQAATLAAAIVLPAAPLSGGFARGARQQIALRSVLCLALVGVVAWRAAAEFSASQSQETDPNSPEHDPFLDYQ